MLLHHAALMLPPWPTNVPSPILSTGFPAIRYARRVPSTGPSGFTLFAGVLQLAGQQEPRLAAAAAAAAVVSSSGGGAKGSSVTAPLCLPSFYLTPLVVCSLLLSITQWARQSWPTASTRWASPTASGVARRRSTSMHARHWCHSCRCLLGGL